MPISHQKVHLHIPSDLKVRVHDQLVPTRPILKTVPKTSSRADRSGRLFCSIRGAQRKVLGIYLSTHALVVQLASREIGVR